VTVVVGDAYLLFIKGRKTFWESFAQSGGVLEATRPKVPSIRTWALQFLVTFANREERMLILTFLRAAREIAVEAMTLHRAMRKRYRGSEE
jgi:hypothetical protein